MTICFSSVIRALTAVRVCSAALLMGVMGTAIAVPDGQELLRTQCSSCHHESEGKFEHISGIRQTPEGWMMTVDRMREAHGLAISDAVREAVVQYLSDTQGLAPGETLAGRFALERRPDATELDLGTDINENCGHCHSLARVSLQRRDLEEWRQLAHLHMAPWTSVAHPGPALDEAWLKIAAGAVAEQLTARYPLESGPWTLWKDRPAGDLSGTWVVVGRVPGGHDFQGTASIERDDAGNYRAKYQLADTADAAFTGESKAMLYTGYEWRGSAEIGGRALREVYTVGPSGNKLAGRWFDPDHPEDGGEWLAFRDNGKARMFAMLPHALRPGTITDVVIVGTGLEKQPGSLSLGDGTLIFEEHRDSHSIRARVKIADDAQPGARNASVGSVGALGLLAIYRQIDQIEVTPKNAVARLGEGTAAPVSAQFQAIGSTRLPSGTLLQLGPVAADWSAAAIDADARRRNRIKLAGQLDQRGRFLPAEQGAHPAQKVAGDAGRDMWVIAKSRDAQHVEGRAHLLVTDQKENLASSY